MIEENSRIALFDLDGTLCDFEGAMRQNLNQIKGEDEPDYLDPNVRIFCPDVSSYFSARRRMIMKTPGFWRSLQPIDIGFKLLRAVQETGFRVNILTKGPAYAPNAWAEKLEWCQHYLPEVPVTITQNKGLVYGKILVDDYVENMQLWLRWRPRGLGLMADLPENKDFVHAQVFKYNEDNIEEAIERINGVAYH
jgi:5'(3')-deoxyribonucleotidase